MKPHDRRRVPYLRPDLRHAGIRMESSKRAGRADHMTEQQWHPVRATPGFPPHEYTQPTTDEVADELIEKLPPKVSHALDEDQLDAIADAVRGMLRRPTREQIAELREQIINAIIEVRDKYPRDPRDADSEEVADAVLALIQNGADR